VAVIPHTHWDREWYAPFQTFRLSLVDLLDRLVELLEEDPLFRCFLLDGQMAMVDDYLEVRPEAEPRLRRLAGAGRLSIGPFYVLPDEFLVSGETLVRNLQLGLERASALGGAMPVGYLPDSFGHVAQIPQLLRLAGFEHAVVWRGVPSAVDRTAFVWSAPDGSAVRAEYLISSYSNGARIGPDERDLLLRLEEEQARLGPALAGRLLVMAGHDHEAPPPHLPSVVERANATQDRFRLRLCSLPEALAQGPSEGLPSHKGELRSSARAHLLMGVVSNRVDLRQAAAAAERALERRAEPLSALFLPPRRWPRAFLDLAWREVIRNAAHDSICACSADETMTAVLERYRQARQIADGLAKRALSSLATSLSHSGPVVVNPSARARGGVVELEAPADLQLEGVQELLDPEAGARPGARRLLTRVEGVPGFGWAAWRPVRPQHPVKVAGRSMTNGLCTVEVDPADGTFSLDGHGGLCRLVDGGDAGDTYNWSPPDHDRLVEAPSAVEIEVMEAGPVRARMDVRRRYRWPDRVEEAAPTGRAAAERAAAGRAAPEGAAAERSPRPPSRRAGGRGVWVTTRLELLAGERAVRVAVSWDNAHRDHRLRALFALPEGARHSLADCAFAVVERGLVAEAGEGEAGVPTYPARRFVRAGGLTVVHDGAFEYELTEISESGEPPSARSLAVTLLRATGWLSKAGMPTRPSAAGPQIPLEGPQLPGRRESHLTVAIACENPYALADDVLCPLEVVEAGGGGPRPGTGAALVAEGAEVSALRRTPAGLEVRLFNPTPAPAAVSFGGRAGTVVDLRGNPVGAFRDRLELGPWQIATAVLGDARDADSGPHRADRTATCPRTRRHAVD
jgi:hypothetical protein